MNIPITYVQHHKAHFSAVLQENHLIHSSQPVLGVVWDGTGLGEDGKIWGSEFFIYKDLEMTRIHHLSEFPVILGDKMSLEPRLSALAICHDLEESKSFLSSKFNVNEWKLYNRHTEKPHFFTDSMGRLFDGVASLLGLTDKVSFEGQAAMYLEKNAREFKGKSFPYFVQITSKQIVTETILRGILSDLYKNEKMAFIAYRFHLTLVEIIRQVALLTNIKNIAFSGGVFQNQLLVELIIEKLSTEFTLHFHQSLSPNDECVSFGQIVYGYILSEQEKLQKDHQFETLSK